MGPANQPGPPPTPTGLTPAPDANSIVLTWNSSAGATGYNVYRDTDNVVSTTGTPLNGATPLTATTYDDTSVTGGVTYFYVVVAVNSFGPSAPTAPVSASITSGVTCNTSSQTTLNFSSTVAGTYGGSGFGCFMPGTIQPTGANLAVNTAASHLVVTSTAGDVYQTVNTQENALGLQLSNSGSYSVRARIKGPFSPSVPYQSAGVYLALDMNNYAKLAIGQGGNGARLEFGVETGAAFTPVVPDTPFNLGDVSDASEAVDLWLNRNSNGTIEALYRPITNLSGPPVLGPIVSLGTTTVAPAWSGSTLLYGGLVTTHFGTGTAINVTFDEFQFGPPITTGGGGSSITFTKKVILKEGTTVGPAFGVPGFDNPTSLARGPDGRLYVATQDSLIYIVTLNPQTLGTPGAATVTHVQTIYHVFNVPTKTCNIGGNPNNCQFVAGSPVGRQITGLAIGPDSTPTQIKLYVTHSDPRIGDNNSEVALSIDPWSGTLTRLDLQISGADFVVNAMQDIVVGLPRSRENHGPNAIAFGPGNWLYFTLGGNTNFGQPSSFFSGLPETYLSASVMRFNTNNLTGLPLNVQGASAGSMAQYSNRLELYATGFRNSYDLTWHSNGQLYLNDNAGNGGLGNTPGASDGCSTTSINPGTLADTLHRVLANDYGGHPNPARGQCVLKDGTLYNPDLPVPPNFRASMLSYNQGASTNGIAEYTSNAFGGQLKGNLISATYAGNQNVRRIVLSANGTSVVQEVNLGSFVQPLDLTTDSTGIVFVAEHGGDQVTLLIPDESAGFCPSATLTDDDGDGFLDTDEATHGTDPCNASSFPPDLDGDHIGDLSDANLDGDGTNNTTDQLHYDPANGATDVVPLSFDWNPGDPPLGGIANTGFLGAQIAANGPRVNTSLINVGAAGGFMSLATTDGTAQGATNSQVNALQVGFDSTQPFRIWTRIVEPFNSVTAAAGHVGGMFFGFDQNNFVRLAIVGQAGGGKAVELRNEVGGTSTVVGTSNLGTGAITSLDLYLAVPRERRARVRQERRASRDPTS